MLAGVGTCFYLFGRGSGKETVSIRGLAIFSRQLTDAVKIQVHAQEARLHSSSFHMLLSVNLSERTSADTGRFGAHQRSHPNTIWWKQEALGAVCASGFSKQVIISPTVPVKHCPLSFWQRIIEERGISWYHKKYILAQMCNLIFGSNSSYPVSFWLNELHNP